MGYYFAMCKSDLNDFFTSTESNNGLIDVAIGVTIKTFPCRLVKEYENIVTLEIDQNIDKETSCTTLILMPKDYPIGDKIKVHLVNHVEETYIGFDYNDYRKDKVKVKHRFYFTLDKEQEKKFIKWTGNVDERKNHIIMMNWNNADRDLFTVTHIKDDHLKDYKVYYIMISLEQFHVSKDSCGGYQKQVYKSFVDEEFDTIKFFTTINDVYNYINKLKCNDIEMPWNRSCVNVKQAFGTSIENKSLKSKYYFAINTMYESDIIKYNKIKMRNFNSLDLIYYDVKFEKTFFLDEYKIYSILLNPNDFHVAKDKDNGYARQVYTNSYLYRRVKFFENMSDLLDYLTPKGNITIGNINTTTDAYVTINGTSITSTYGILEENKMTVKDIKVNGPATIIFWADNTKTIVKCQAGEQNDPEKGVIMALVKGLFQKYKGTNNWTEAFNIPYSDEIDVEKVIGLALLRDHYGHVLKDPEWHYNYVLKWVYKNKGYKIEDEIAALKALGYSDERIKKCLKTNLGVIRNALGQDMVYKKEQKIPATLKSKSEEKFINSIRFPSGEEYNFVVNKEETKKVLKDIIKEDSLSDKVIKMFNDGEKIAKIAKTLGISEYFVKKALDEVTKPKANPKKINRILKNAMKEKIVHKKHVKHTEIVFPNYLEKEEAEKILAATKLKYANVPKINCLSELQKYFDRECRIYKIKQLYGKNGYSMYEIAKIIGVSVNSVQSLYTRHKEEIDND